MHELVIHDGNLHHGAGNFRRHVYNVHTHTAISGPGCNHIHVPQGNPQNDGQ